MDNLQKAQISKHFLKEHYAIDLDSCYIFTEK